MIQKYLAYIVLLRACNQDCFLLWQDGGGAPDRYIIYPETKKFLSASSSGELLSKAREIGLQVADQKPVLVDLDKVFRALDALRPNRRSSLRTCQVLLDGWNALEDMARSIDIPSHSAAGDPELIRLAYEKIFYGNNLPSVTPEAKYYNPLFSSEEIGRVRSYFLYLWQAIVIQTQQFCSDKIN